MCNCEIRYLLELNSNQWLLDNEIISIIIFNDNSVLNIKLKESNDIYFMIHIYKFEQ